MPENLNKQRILDYLRHGYTGDVERAVSYYDDEIDFIAYAPIEIFPADQRSSIFLTLDGQVVQELEPGDRLRITKSPRTLSLAMLSEMSFFEVLRQKLKWSGTAV